jgi:hypothetical protein
VGFGRNLRYMYIPQVLIIQPMTDGEVIISILKCLKLRNKAGPMRFFSFLRSIIRLRLALALCGENIAFCHPVSSAPSKAKVHVFAVMYIMHASWVDHAFPTAAQTTICIVFSGDFIVNVLLMFRNSLR